MSQKRFAVAAAAGCLLLGGCAGQRPDNLIPHNGRLADCPSSPNCVSSQSADPEKAIVPFHYEDDRQVAFDRLKRVVTDLEGTTIVAEGDTWLHVECRSAVMGFVDDVVFSFSEDNRIHIRSASRLGYSDLGVNRKRVERLRDRFETVREP